MIDNEKLPIGFTMELAQHSDALIRFSNMTGAEKQSVIDGAKQVRSRSEMRAYVEQKLGAGGPSNDRERFF